MIDLVLSGPQIIELTRGVRSGHEGKENGQDATVNKRTPHGSVPRALQLLVGYWFG